MTSNKNLGFGNIYVPPRNWYWNEWRISFLLAGGYFGIALATGWIANFLP